MCSVIIESSDISNLDSLAQGQCGDKAGSSFSKVLRMNQTDEWLLLANCLLADHINMRSNLEDVQLLILDGQILSQFYCDNLELVRFSFCEIHPLCLTGMLPNNSSIKHLVRLVTGV